jgi:outer membrane protein assembly factor BamB
MVVAASDVGKIYAFDRTTGESRWSAPQLSGLPPGTSGSPDADYRPIIASGGLIVAGSTTGYIVAYDATTGAERWRTTANKGSATYLLAADDAAVYVTYSGLQLGAFDVATGSLKWLAGDDRSGGEFYPFPAPDGDRLYVSGLTGYYALRK